MIMRNIATPILSNLQSPLIRPAGFTLVELLITILVLAVLVSLAVPAFQTSIEKRRLVEAAEAVFSQVQFARSESLKQSRDLLVDATTNGSTTWCVGISQNTAGCTCSTTASCVITQGGTSNVEKTLASSAFSNIRMTNTSFEIVFSRLRGTLAGVGNTVVLKSPSNLELRVVVSALGRIRMCSPAGAGNVGGYPTC